MIYSFNGHTPQIPDDTFVDPTATIIGDAKIGHRCYIGPNVVIRADHGTIEIGDNNAVEDFIMIHTQENEHLKIGSGNIFGHGVTIHCHSIGDHTIIGMGAILCMDSIIDSESIVAEGSVVKNHQHVLTKTLVGGTPAKFIRDLVQFDLDKIRAWEQEYVDMVRKYITEPMVPVK